VLAAAGRGFRQRGYEGIGVDGLAKEAGVTSGSFYVHFPSKAEAFNEAVVNGLIELREGIAAFQAQHGDAWIEVFIDFYLGTKRTCELTDACALQTLTPEVVRAGPEVRRAYQSELVKVVDAVARGLPQQTAAERRGAAWALLSLLSGAVTTSRAVGEKLVADRIAKSARTAAVTIARG
jgi:TetR/AcrR family transcriptional regulator, transcriptional repressor for nem operon